MTAGHEPRAASTGRSNVNGLRGAIAFGIVMATALLPGGQAALASEIAEKVKAIVVATLGVDEKAVTESARFREDLGADELDGVELVLELEKEFKIAVSEEEAEALLGGSVGELIRFVEERVHPPDPH
jgi:acyl carrier protein